MNQWKVDVIQVARATETKQLWRWVPLPPLSVLRACLRDRHCQNCRGAVGPFLFIGKLPNGPYMAFRRPIQLIRNGTLGLVIQPIAEPTKTPTQESAPAQAPDPRQFRWSPTLKSDLPETPLHKKPVILRVVDLPKKRVTKATKKTSKPAKKAAKLAKTPMKKVAKKGAKPAPKKTTRRRRPR